MGSKSQGKNPALPPKPLHPQAAAHPQEPVGIEGLWLDQREEGMRQDVISLHC